MKRLAIPFAVSIACVSTASYAGQVISNGADIKISTTGGLKAATSDGEYNFQLGGRLQWDYDSFDYSDAGGAEGSDSEMRRGRIYVKGTIKKHWAYKLQLEFGSAEEADGSQEVDLEDAYITYTGLPVQLKFGRYKMPFGLEELTSSKNITTVERAAFWDFVPSSRSDYSFQVGQNKSNYTWALGIFENEDGNEEGIKDSDGDLTYSYAGRATYLPINTDNNLVHLGAAFLSRDYDDNLQRARLRTRLGTHTGSRIVLADAGTTGEESSQIGLEAAWRSGPLSIQGEYVSFEIKTDNTVSDDVEFDGYYLQAAYTLTGESRGYKKGAFDKIKPSDKGGAWELVLKHENGEADYLTSSEYDLTTLGVNWYINSNVRASLNYLSGEVDGTATDGDFDAVSTRLQLVF